MDLPLPANFGALILTLLASKYKFPDNDLATSEILINLAVTLAGVVVFSHVFSTLFTMTDFVRNCVQSILNHVIFTAMALLAASFVMKSIDKTKGNLLEMEHSLMANNLILVFFPLVGAVPLKCCGSDMILEKLLCYVFKEIFKYFWNNRVEAIVLVFASVFGMILLMTKGVIPALGVVLAPLVAKLSMVGLIAVFKFFWPPAPPHPQSVNN